MNKQITDSDKKAHQAVKKAVKKVRAGEKLKGAEKVARIPIKVQQPAERLRKPSWIRAKSPFHPNVKKLKSVLREQKLFTVCEEAACPNLGECFGKGTATFMIMGEICTRRCPFCDVGHGRPNPLDTDEPSHLAETIRAMALQSIEMTCVMAVPHILSNA
jgi:lipoyl synthase